MQFSSGTTGLRKGVFISDRRLVAQLEALRESIDIQETDIVACWLPLYHDMGLVTSLLLPLYFGCSVVFLDPVNGPIARNCCSRPLPPSRPRYAGSRISLSGTS